MPFNPNGSLEFRELSGKMLYVPDALLDGTENFDFTPNLVEVVELIEQTIANKKAEEEIAR